MKVEKCSLRVKCFPEKYIRIMLRILGGIGEKKYHGLFVCNSQSFLINRGGNL